MNIKPIDILIADDNEDDLILIREALEQGRMVNVLQTVSDGEEVMAYLRRQGKYADAARPGLVLLDINMPRKNGLEALDEIKRDPDLKTIPVIMLTVSNRDEDIVRAYAAGASTYIRKPVKFDQFQKTVEQFSLYWALVATIPAP